LNFSQSYISNIKEPYEKRDKKTQRRNQRYKRTKEKQDIRTDQEEIPIPNPNSNPNPNPKRNNGTIRNKK
jgi:hypothetical protein